MEFIKKHWKDLVILVLVFLLVSTFLGKKRTVEESDNTTASIVETEAPAETAVTKKTPKPSSTPEPTPTPTVESQDEEEELLDEYGTYDTKDEVALYIHQYHKLPENFMTKKQARKKGWESGALNRVVSGKCIGGDTFGNYEGILPEGHTYTECDIGTLNAKSRGAKRIVFSEDWWIYYTDDHYETFELLYEGDAR